MNNLKTAFYEL